MIGIDTNILLRWLLDESISDDDAPHQTALVSAHILDGKETCFANAVVVAETLWVLAHPMKQPKAVLVDIVERLLASFNVEVSEPQAVHVALDAYRTGNAGFVDYLIGEINAKAGCTTTLTFDKKAAKSERFTLLN
ncbi:MAG: type II toxin-antitoxin system VapC family toxin [Pseudomonadota bacterium]